MPPRKNPREFFGKGREWGSERYNEKIDGSAVLKKLTPSVQQSYQRIIGLWNQYTADHARDEPSPYDVKSLKGFIMGLAFGIDGAAGDPNPGYGTVMGYWKKFMAGWRREYAAIPKNFTLSTTNFIKYELPDILKDSEIRLVKSKRPRRYATTNHFFHLGNQLWGNNWVEYEKPATRVYDWADFMAIVCSSARIGEYIESSCRAGTGRGLYYKDVKFGVFRDEHGNAEFAIQLVRDAKGMTDSPDKRPEHALYEGLGPIPLICNVMLPMLAILITAKAFKDYDTVEDLLDIEPPEGEMVPLLWKESVRDQPFFKSMSTRKAAGEMERANAFAKRLRLLGFRAGYADPPTVHDFRAEGLYWIDKLYSEAQRMKHAGHTDPATYNKHYQPNNSGTDGQASYFGQEVRSIVNNLFRGLTVARNSQLPQSLPAEKQEALRTSSEFIAIEKDLAALSGRRDRASTSRRAKLYQKKRMLTDRELRQWQKAQRHGSGTTGGAEFTQCYHRSIFNRVRFLLPERDRLASNLFKTDTLRSPTGLQALRDMIALCEVDAEVKFRLGLEQKCRCAGSLPQSAGTVVDKQPTYDWNTFTAASRKHAVALPSFASCATNGFSTNPNGAAIAAYILLARTNCLCSATLLPTAECLPYERYIQAVDDEKPVTCPYLRCNVAFDSVERFKFHLLDAHCRNFVKEPTPPELEDEDDAKLAPPVKQRKRCVGLEREAKIDTYSFVDEADQTARRCRAAAAFPPSPFEGHMSPPGSLHMQGWSDDGGAGSGDFLLRWPSSLDNDGAEKCFPMIDFGPGQSPASVLSVYGPAIDGPYSASPADAIVSGFAPFPYVNPADMWWQERQDMPLPVYDSPGGDGGSNSDTAGLTNNMAQFAPEGNFFGADDDGKDDNVDIPPSYSDVALPPAPTPIQNRPLNGGKKRRIKLVIQKERTSEGSDGTEEPPKKRIKIILKIGA